VILSGVSNEYHAMSTGDRDAAKGPVPGILLLSAIRFRHTWPIDDQDHQWASNPWHIVRFLRWYCSHLGTDFIVLAGDHVRVISCVVRTEPRSGAKARGDGRSGTPVASRTDVWECRRRCKAEPAHLGAFATNGSKGLNCSRVLSQHSAAEPRPVTACSIRRGRRQSSPVRHMAKIAL
jgi:hypothetical protein